MSDRHLRVLYRDPRLVVVHKPSGLLVHRTALDVHADDFVVQRARDQLGCRVWPVHRLDRPTSGALVLALDRDTLRRLSEGFAARRIDKRYHAIVRGWPATEGLIEKPLPGPGGHLAEARTAWRVLATTELPIPVDRYESARYSWLELRPLTGRRHQLRRHLRSLRHPIVGDTSYGDRHHNRMLRARLGLDRLMLVAVSLAFDHPWDEDARVEIDTTDEAFGALCARLGLASPQGAQR